VNDLKKANESLGKELDDLKKRLEATYPEKATKAGKKKD
jgi:tetrahydromethanopterin S-methyltransferase subunit G